MRRFLVGAGALAVVTAGLAIAARVGAAEEQAPQPQQGYAGTATCLTCHADQQASIAKSPHGTVRTGIMTPASARGCESCHGPGATHAETPARTNILSFSSDSPPAAKSQACLACHGRDPERFRARRSEHQATGVSCESCHSAHAAAANTPALLRSAAPGLCYSCHQEVRAQFQQRFRHRVNERAMTCMDCHSPHGTGELKQVKRTGTESNPCVSCHSEKRGPFTFEHLSVRAEGCATCHAPHGSTNRYLLRYQDQKALCLECHTNTPTFHNVSTPRFANCTTCHTQIHGSYMSRFFFE